MYEIFKEKYPDVKCSRESYRTIFTTKFNVAFGYPRKDTCSRCDELRAEIDSLQENHEKERVRTEMNDHQANAQVFYDRKSAKGTAAKSDHTRAAVAFDFWKNLPTPNITTNDVFYRRQLSVHAFNIHVLSSNAVFVYMYNETVAKRGADDVCSMLYHFFCESVPNHVHHLDLFCDGSAGQNKNWTMIRFVYFMVHIQRRFGSITLHFPIRGHSYLECDRDMSNVKQDTRTEHPSDWENVVRAARKHPAPYNIISMNQEMFLRITDGLKPRFRATCPVPTRPIRELKIDQDHPEEILHRSNWGGEFETAPVMPNRRRRGPVQEITLKKAYTQAIPLSKEKFKDLQVLKRFCSAPNQDFYAALPTNKNVPDTEETIGMLQEQDN